MFPYQTVGIAIILVFICALGLPHIVVHGNVEAMLDKNDPLLLQLHAIEDEFTENHSVSIGVVSDHSTVFSKSTLSMLMALTEDAWKIPYTYRVDSITNFQHTQVDVHNLNIGDMFTSEIIKDGAAFLTSKQAALTLPETVNQLVSANEKMTALHISFVLNGTDSYDEKVAEIMLYIEKILKPYRSDYPNLEFILSGKIAIDFGIQQYIAQDGITLIPLMLLLMAVVLMLLLRSVSATFGTVLIVSLTGITTMGLVGWFHIHLDSASALSPIVIMTLAIADSVHINSGVVSGLNQGMDKREAILYSLKQNVLPIFLTSLTTVLGVITFVFTDLPSIQSLGLIISLGVAIAFVFSVTLLPAVLVLLPIRQNTSNKRFVFLAPFAQFIILHHKKILLPTVLLCALVASLAPQNELNESPELFFKPATPEKLAIDKMNAYMAGTSTIDFALYTDVPGGIASADFLAQLELFTQWLKTQPGVGHVKTLSDTFKQLNKNMHADDQAWYKQPETQELAAQYLLLYEMSLPFGLDLTNQVNLDKSGVRITVTTKHLHAAQKLALKYEALDWWEQKNSSVRVVPTGHATIMDQFVIERFMPDMLRGGLIAIAMVSLVLLVVFRSWKLGLIGMLANIVPVAMGYGIWSQINGIANFAVMSVAGICLGVVVDFAVHFLTKYQMARLNGNTAEGAIRYAFDKIGYPLWTTTLVLVCGFWVLALSAITLNAALGMLTGIIMLLALLFDFIVLPCILLTFDRATATAEHEN
jgi:hypothetical protein